ncbi:SDR family NAD(P)-dependent oxidoreductase [Ciceribacter thiooxidans]|uniref:SDR family NAD(P)-dependent oxidoreductase n=1 Tax=Ciceribacter thiooxidans TaxID=1969821 RepID=A0ABV7ICG2_9HYPH|nr:SDR family NAD(P)-dependent oxidoreductase [Ciceribacter thiooxidans]
MKQPTDLEKRHPLAGSVVVIVGGTSGMGRGAAVRLAAHGAQVLAVSRRAVSGIVQLGHGSIERAALDMTDEAAVRGFLDGTTTLDHLLVTATPPNF